MSLVRSVRTATDNHNHHIHSLRRYGLAVPGQLFQTSSQTQPTWRHDAVVSNAGVADLKAKFNEPQNLDMDDLPKPDMRVLDVNLVAVLYPSSTVLSPSEPSLAACGPEQEHKQDRGVAARQTSSSGRFYGVTPTNSAANFVWSFEAWSAGALPLAANYGICEGSACKHDMSIFC
ncbi:hypothetical protein V1504DRAFT_469333 [Lipomyces starkeyi]